MKIKFKADRPWPWSYLRYYYLSVGCPILLEGGGEEGEERRGERDARRLRIKGRPCVYSYHYNVKIKSTILYWVVCKVFGTYQYHAFNRRAYLLLNFCRNNRILVSSEFHSEENRIQTWIFIDLNDLKNHCHRQK